MQLLNNYLNKISKPLVLIVLLALSIRLVGVNYGLPNDNFHSDEPKMVLSSTHVAVNFTNNKTFSNLEQPQYKYPHGVMNTFSTVFIGIYYLTRIVDKVMHITPIIFSTFDNSTFTLFARVIVAVMGSLLVWIVYLIGKELKLSKYLSLMWALLITVSFGLSVHSKYATRNIVSILYAYISLLFLIKFLNEKKIKYLIFGSFMVGVSIVSSIERAFFAVPIFIIILLVAKTDLLKIIKLGLISAFFIFLGMFIASPFIFLNFDRFLENGLVGQSDTQEYGQIERTATNFGYMLWNNNKVDFDNKVPNSIAGIVIPLVFVLSILGILYKLLFKRDKYDLILLGILVSQLIVFGQYRSQMIRWYIALIPIFLYYFTYFTLNTNFTKYKKGLTVMFFIGVSLNLFYSVEYSYSKTLKDTRVIAKEWLNKNLDKSSMLFGTYWSSAGDFNKKGIPFYYYEQRHNMQSTIAPDPKLFFCSINLEAKSYVVVSSYVTTIYNYPETKNYYKIHTRSFLDFYDYIDKNFKLIKTINGDELFNNPGPTLKVYEIVGNQLQCKGEEQ